MTEVQYRAVRPFLNDGQMTVLQCDEDGSLYVNIADTSSGLVNDRSGTITLAGVSQVIMVSNSRRNGYFIQNTSSDLLWINELGVPAVQSSPSIMIPPGFLYQSPLPGTSSADISVIGSVTGQAFTAREW